MKALGKISFFGPFLYGNWGRDGAPLSATRALLALSRSPDLPRARPLPVPAMRVALARSTSPVLSTSPVQVQYKSALDGAARLDFPDFDLLRVLYVPFV